MCCIGILRLNYYSWSYQIDTQSHEHIGTLRGYLSIDVYTIFIATTFRRDGYETMLTLFASITAFYSHHCQPSLALENYGCNMTFCTFANAYYEQHDYHHHYQTLWIRQNCSNIRNSMPSIAMLSSPSKISYPPSANKFISFPFSPMYPILFISTKTIPFLPKLTNTVNSRISMTITGPNTMIVRRLEPI